MEVARILKACSFARLGPDSIRLGAHPSAGKGDYKYFRRGGHEVGGHWHLGTAGGTLDPLLIVSDDTNVTDCEAVLVHSGASS